MPSLPIKWIGVFCVCCVMHGHGQYRHAVGLDISKTFPIQYQSGSVIEVFTSHKLKKDTTISFNAAFGYANIGVDPLYYNFSYRNIGAYVKSGFDFRVRQFWSLGANAVYTKFREFGSVILDGDYFGDWSTTVEQKYSAVGLEIHSDFWMPVTDRFFFDVQPRYSMVLSKLRQPDFSTYYAPGIGFLQLNKMDSNARTDAARGAFGISARLIYKF